MAGLDVTEAAFAGVRLLIKRPLAALVWALIYAVFFAVFGALFGGAAYGLIGTLSAAAKTHAPPQLVAAVLAAIGGVFGLYLLFMGCLLVVGSIVSCAVIRAVLEPGAGGMASLRLGRRELRMMLLSFCKGVLMFVIATVLAIPAGIIVALISFGAGMSMAQSIAIRVVEQVVVNGAAFYFYLRFSMAAPMTFDEGRFRLFESWTQTKGRVWRLFLIGLLVGLMAAGLYLVIGLVAVAAGWAMWRDLTGGADPRIFFRRPPAVWLTSLTPLIALGATASMILMTLLTPIVAAPWAKAYRQLKPDDDIASTFA
ncbi:MAG TPA: hypothetical protein VFC47_12025 [Caulobacteraceae bacterium]|nr:hypothetical protein [Caulobacteraceae bacterium]